MGEVYWGLFNASLDDAAEQVGAPGALQVVGFPAVAAAAGKGMSALSSSRWMETLISITKISGVSSGPVTKALIKVRRSRRFSRTSFRNTVTNARLRRARVGLMTFMRPGPRRCR